MKTIINAGPSYSVIGIDPGIKGAIAVIDMDSGDLKRLDDMPVNHVIVNGKSKAQVCPYTLASYLRPWEKNSYVYVERVGSMPGQGVTSMFNFGRSFGVIEGVVAGLKMRINYVQPSVWKKSLKLPAGKDASRQLAAQLFPANAEQFRLVKHDGRAEAALIALYGTKS